MPYSGGKQRIARHIINLFPEHDHYIEPYAGGLSVLLAKAPSRLETVNDLNGDLVTFWRVLRDRPDDLERVCALTPHSRDEVTAARDLDVPDDLERARRVWVQLTQARGASLGPRQGFRFVHAANGMSMAGYLDGYLARIGPAAERLRQVTLECRPALDIINIYDRPGALFYLDPPYPASTRAGAQYAHEMLTDGEHEELLARALAVDGAVVISGYAHPLYDRMLGGWSRHEFAERANSGAARVEVVWANREPTPTLFDTEEGD